MKKKKERKMKKGDEDDDEDEVDHLLDFGELMRRSMLRTTMALRTVIESTLKRVQSWAKWGGRSGVSGTREEEKKKEMMLMRKVEFVTKWSADEIGEYEEKKEEMETKKKRS